MHSWIVLGFSENKTDLHCFRKRNCFRGFKCKGFDCVSFTFLCDWPTIVSVWHKVTLGTQALHWVRIFYLLAKFKWKGVECSIFPFCATINLSECVSQLIIWVTHILKMVTKLFSVWEIFKLLHPMLGQWLTHGLKLMTPSAFIGPARIFTEIHRCFNCKGFKVVIENFVSLSDLSVCIEKLTVWVTKHFEWATDFWNVLSIFGSVVAHVLNIAN